MKMNILIRKISNIKTILFLSIIGITTIIYSLFQKKDEISNFNEQTEITIIDLRHGNGVNYLLFVGIFLFIFSFILLIVKHYSKNEIKVNNRTTLTPKENEVLLLIEKKYSNKDIANELFISVSTVKTHINNIFKKMKVKKRSDLMKKA